MLEILSLRKRSRTRSSLLRSALCAAALVVAGPIAVASASADEPPQPQPALAPTAQPPPAAPATPSPPVAPSVVAGPESATPAPPPVGSLSMAQIDAYLAQLERPIDELKQRYELARTRDEREDLKDQLAAAKAHYRAERERLSTNNKGLAAGGGVLVGLGGASLIASLVTAIAYGISGIDTCALAFNPCVRNDPNQSLAIASLSLLGTGVVLEGAGVPMLVIGLKTRVPRTAATSFVPVTQPVPAGASLVFRF